MPAWIKARYPLAQVISMQNGVSAYGSRVTQVFVPQEFGEGSFWNKDDWSPSSPDLNALDFPI